IRDLTVTGVQTCALPIFLKEAVYRLVRDERLGYRRLPNAHELSAMLKERIDRSLAGIEQRVAEVPDVRAVASKFEQLPELHGGKIGRASCRERVEVGVGG